MSTTGEHDVWTAQQLAARLAALKGRAPAPRGYIVWRATSAPGVKDQAGYELPGGTSRDSEAAFERFLEEEGLTGPDRLAVSVLAIREQLDEAGLVREAILERRRGGVSGPYYGKVARVEFTGAATRVRRYRANSDGRLSALPVEDDPSPPPPGDLDAESFAGEDAAVQAFTGPGSVILDRRAPSLFEDMAGFSGIIHVRRRDGTEIGCGVGWHGGTAFVLAADFPRHGRPMAAPPDLDAAVEAALRDEDLIRHETRLDETGFRVIARRRGRQSLVSLYLEDDALRIEPYRPGRDGGANEDQRRWMTYAETYEARTVLDVWRDGEGEAIAVLTVDPDNEAWRHIIDADGIEVSRRPDNEAAAAVLWRERLAPPEPLPDSPPPPSVPASAPPSAPPPAIEPPPAITAPPGTLLAKIQAWARVTAQLRGAAAADRAQAMARLSTLPEALRVLNVRDATESLGRLLEEGGTMNAEAFAAALDDIGTSLSGGLAAVSVAELPSARRRLTDEAPFGALVEAQFPSAAYDIEEAVQCLALRRTTAAVMHTMNVMRYGLRGIEHLLNTGDLTGLSWTKLIAIVRAASGPEHRPLLDALVQVRRVWRAPDLMPAAKYTADEAEAVLEAAAIFMRALAVSHDADGVTPAE